MSDYFLRFNGGRNSIKIYYMVSFVQVLMLFVIGVVSIHTFRHWQPGTMKMLSSDVKPVEYRDFIKNAYAQDSTFRYA